MIEIIENFVDASHGEIKYVDNIDDFYMSHIVKSLEVYSTESILRRKMGTLLQVARMENETKRKQVRYYDHKFAPRMETQDVPFMYIALIQEFFKRNISDPSFVSAKNIFLKSPITVAMETFSLSPDLYRWIVVFDVRECMENSTETELMEFGKFMEKMVNVYGNTIRHNIAVAHNRKLANILMSIVVTTSPEQYTTKEVPKKERN